MNNGAKLPSAARGCGRGRRRQLRPVPGRRRPGRARGLGRAAPHTCSRGAQAGTPPAEKGESRSALPNATSPGVLWHRTRRESARELPSRRRLFLTCSPFHPSLSGLRARLPPRPPPAAEDAGSSPRSAAPDSERLPQPAAPAPPRASRGGISAWKGPISSRVPFCEILEPAGLGAGSPARSSPRLPPRSPGRRGVSALPPQTRSGWAGAPSPLWISPFSPQHPPFFSHRGSWRF